MCLLFTLFELFSVITLLLLFRIIVCKTDLKYLFDIQALHHICIV